MYIWRWILVCGCYWVTEQADKQGDRKHSNQFENKIAKEMKPTKNKVFCKDCERTKMLFETEKNAANFIKFNNEEIEAESGYSPQRSYYCLFCGGWHITSRQEQIGLSQKEQMFERYKQEKEKKKEKKIVNQFETIIRNSNKVENQQKRNMIIKDLESHIKEMEPSQIEKFFLENINIQKKEIKLLQDSKSLTDKEKLKDLRQNLEILYLVGKQAGIKNNNSKLEEVRQKEIEEWKLWIKKQGY